MFISPPPLVSKKSASHLRTINRTHQPLVTRTAQTPSKHELALEPVDISDKENTAPASASKQRTPRSHKDLFAVKTASVTHALTAGGSGSREADVVRGAEWRSEERASAMRRLRSMR